MDISIVDERFQQSTVPGKLLIIPDKKSLSSNCVFPKACKSISVNKPNDDLANFDVKKECWSQNDYEYTSSSSNQSILNYFYEASHKDDNSSTVCTTHILDKKCGPSSKITIYEDEKTGETWTIKSVSLFDPQKVANLKHESKLLHYLKHPCIIKINSGLNKYNLEAFIELEHLKGCDLFDYLSKHRYVSEKEAQVIMSCSLSALAYIHSQGVIHRDVKPENLVFSIPNEFYSIKLIDFGLAQYVGHKFIEDQKISGTAGYIAPEILQRLPYGTTSDIYSLGITLFFLLSGIHPFYDFNERKMDIKKNCFGVVKFDHPIWKSRSKSVKSLILRMCTPDAKTRPFASQILNDEWFVETL